MIELKISAENREDLHDQLRDLLGLKSPPAIIRQPPVPIAPSAPATVDAPPPPLTVVPNSAGVANAVSALTESAATVAAVENPLDSMGQPWDSRIHAKTKSKKADESWTLKRNVEKTLVAQIRAEHAATTGAATVAGAGVPPTATAQQPLVPTVPGAPDVAATIALCSQLLAAGKTPEMIASISAQIAQVMTECNLPDGATSLIANPSKAPEVHSKLRVIGAGIGLAC